MLRKVSFLISFVLVMLGGVLPLQATETRTLDYVPKEVSVFGRTVSTYVPSDWQLAAAREKVTDNTYLMELLPRGQAVNAWQEMITILGYKDAEASPREFFTVIYATQKAICIEGNVAAEVLHDTPDVLIALLMCGEVKPEAMGTSGLQEGQGEMMFYRLQKRDDDLYLIFKSWRGAGYDVEAMDIEGALPATLDSIAEYNFVLRRSFVSR